MFDTTKDETTQANEDFEDIEEPEEDEETATSGA